MIARWIVSLFSVVWRFWNRIEALSFYSVIFAICFGGMDAVGFDKRLSSIECLSYKASNKESARKPDICILWDRGKASLECHWANVDWFSGVISKNLNKTIALQALYRTYFLLKVRIMCLFNENYQNPNCWGKRSAVILPKIWFVWRQTRALSFLINLLLSQSFFISWPSQIWCVKSFTFVRKPSRSSRIKINRERYLLL